MNATLWVMVGSSAAAAAIVSAAIQLFVARRRRARELCAAGDHRFAMPPGFPVSPIVYCRRPGCHMQGVSTAVAPGLSVELHNAIPSEVRWPPVHLDAAGNAYPLDGIDDHGMANVSAPPQTIPVTAEDPVGTVYASDGDRWVPATPIPVQGVVGRLEALARRRGLTRIANRLADFDERNLGT